MRRAKAVAEDGDDEGEDLDPTAKAAEAVAAAVKAGGA